MPGEENNFIFSLSLNLLGSLFADDDKSLLDGWSCCISDSFMFNSSVCLRCLHELDDELVDEADDNISTSSMGELICWTTLVNFVGEIVTVRLLKELRPEETTEVWEEVEAELSCCGLSSFSFCSKSAAFFDTVIEVVIGFVAVCGVLDGEEDEMELDDVVVVVVVVVVVAVVDLQILSWFFSIQQNPSGCLPWLVDQNSLHFYYWA
jgi:hypothetical protein